jgi:hypothetical protein
MHAKNLLASLPDLLLASTLAEAWQIVCVTYKNILLSNTVKKILLETPLLSFLNVREAKEKYIKPSKHVISHSIPKRNQYVTYGAFQNLELLLTLPA